MYLKETWMCTWVCTILLCAPVTLTQRGLLKKHQWAEKLNSLIILEILDYLSSTCVFHKKKVTSKLRQRLKSGLPVTKMCMLHLAT